MAKQIIEQNSIRNDYEFYPIIITFDQIKQNGFSIEKAVEEYFSNDIYNSIGIDVCSVLQENRCVVFVDALDEIASNCEKEKAFDCISEFSKNNPSVKLVCSSRPSDFLYQRCSEKEFRSYEIDGLNRRQITQYIQAYFSDNEVLSKRLIKSLKDSGLLEKLPQTPMTLALITIIFDEKQMEIPSTITDLYSIFVDLLLKRFEFKSTVDILETDIKQNVLSYLAKGMHVKGVMSIPKNDALVEINTYLQERGKFELSAKELLEDIINNNALLIYNERGEVQFKHLSFQEFFTAYELYHHLQSERNLFIENFQKLWWQNVALFYAGFSKDAPKLLDEIIKQCRKTEGIIPRFNVMMGLGRLMQSLYSTPVKKRVEGVRLTSEFACKVVEGLIETEEERYAFFKNFSRYNLYQMLLASFEISHHSITLQEPLKRTFGTWLEELNELDKHAFNCVFPMFVIAASMGNSSFLNYGPYRKLIENTRSDDLSLFALEEMWFRENYKELSEEQRMNEDVAWIKKKVVKRMRQLGDIGYLVNIPLNKESVKISQTSSQFNGMEVDSEQIKNESA